MFRITLCLPAPAQRRAVQSLCREYFAGRAENVQIHSVTEKKLDVLVKSDLIFLSAAEPRPNGIDIAQAVRNARGEGAIIFLAADPTFAMEAFGVLATQYFLPPVTKQKFFAALDHLMATRRGPFLLVSTREGQVRVAQRDIEYVECTDHILHFHLTDGRLVRSTTLRIPLKQALASLMQQKNFYQPHRSYVINLDTACQLTETEFVMESGASVPVPRGRAAEAREVFRCYYQPEDEIVL